MNFRRSLWRSEHSFRNVTEVFSAIFLLLSLSICTSSMAQSAETALAPGIKVLAGDFEGHFYTPPDDRILEKLHSHSQNIIGGPPCATINVTYTGFTAEAQTAFQAAVDIWETVIESSVTIEIDATWEPLDPGILGSASSYLHRNFTNAPNTNYFPASLANEIAGTDINPSNPEIVASFSSVYSNWYFGTDGATPAGEYDLMSVVLHEIGHGLGFSSSKDYDPDTGIGSFGHSDGSILYEFDEYLTNGIGGTPLVNYANGTFLGDLLTGGNVYNSSALAAAGNGGNDPKMYAPATYAGGSSISHWDEATYPAGNPQSLMTPSIGQGEAIHNPGDMAIGLLEEMGWPICLTPIVENDSPCNAIQIPCGETISGSTIDATNSETGSPTCANGSLVDLFYTFTAVPGYTYDISVNGDDYDGVLVLYSGACSSLTEIDCADDGFSSGIAENISYTPAADGSEQTMTIRTYDWAAGGGSFDLTVTCLPPNDNPCDATAISCNSVITGNTTGATNSEIGGFSCTGGTIADLFYYLQVDANYTYTFTVQGDNYDGILALYSGNCSSLTEIACVDDGLSSGIAETIVYESTTSQILFVRTSDWFASAGEFLLTVDCAASNQDPCDALEIGCGQILSGSTNGGSQSAVASPSCANGSLIDTYYQFEAFPGGTYQVLVNGDGYDGVLVAYTGLCEGELTQIACADNGTQNGIEEEINITVDEATTILVRTYDWSGTSDFEISLNCFPDNDQPCDALPIACGETINGGNTGATDSPLADPSCASANSSDVFYTFDADPSLIYTATVNGANYDGVLVAYSGTCDGTLAEIACADNGLSAGIEETITFQLETAGTVLLRTMDWGTSGGEFEISLSCSPENDNACDALPISCGESLHGGTYFADVSTPVIDPTCTGGSKQDVFYEFMALPGFEYEITVDGDSDYDAVLAAYSGDCDGSLTELACSDEDFTNGGDEVVTLTVESETQIIIQTYDYFPSQGTFQIYLECTELPDCLDLGLNIGDPCDDGDTETINDTVTPECECQGVYPIPDNDQCENAESISVQAPGECNESTATIGTTNGAIDDLGPYSCDDAGAWPDVFYSFNSGPYNNVLLSYGNITQTDIVVSVSETCGGIELFCEIGPGDYPVAVNPNTDYIIRVSANISFGSTGAFILCLEGIYDCPLLSGNIGDSCDDGNSETENDTITPECECQGTIVYDCPDLLANIGDSCDDSNPGTIDDIVNADCECVGTPIPDNDTCEDAQALTLFEPGGCDGNGTFGTTNGAADDFGAYGCDFVGSGWPDVFYSFNSGEFNQVVIFIDLITQGDIVVEVLESCGGASVGCGVELSQYFIDVEPNTDYIIRTGPNLDFGGPGDFTICVEGLYDCPILEANVGDACDDGDSGTIDDVVTLDCTCQGVPTTASIIGSYEWNSDCGPRDMTISFYEPGTANLVEAISTTLAADGSFSVSNVPVGLFDVYIKISGILQKGYFGATIVDGPNPFSDSIPPRGDFNDDNGINISDFSIFNAAFGSSSGDANYNFLTDMNCDGGVNVVDFSIFNSNFGASGQEP